MNNNENKPMIIIDNGTGFIKAGFSGDKKPKAVFPTLIGREKNKENSDSDFYVGDIVYEKYDSLNVKCPISRGIIFDWNEMEKIWDYTFNQALKVSPSEHNILLTQNILNVGDKIKKMCQIMFETFNVPGLWIQNQPSLSLYAAGKYTGFVIDSGESNTQFVPYFDGFLVDKFRIDFGGNDVTKFLIKMLNIGILTETKENIIAEDIKKNLCYIALNFEDEKVKNEKKTYKMPDGNEINISNECFIAPEILFNPKLYDNFQLDNFAKICSEIIFRNDEILRGDLFDNIILSGGNTLFKGIEERFSKEINNFASESRNFMKFNARVSAPSEREYYNWIGGSILSSINLLNSQIITRKEYNETGPSIIYKIYNM